MALRKIGQIFANLLIFFRSVKLAIVLLILVFLSSILGVILPTALGREIIFSSLWFNSLLILLTVNVLFCTLKRFTNLRKSIREYTRIGSIIFHFSFILLFLGVVYDNLFFFEGGIRLTEGESLSCTEEQNYDWIRKGRFFETDKLKNLGEVYFSKLYPSYYVKNDYKGVANKIIIRTESNPPAGGKEGIIYENSPLRYKGFEFYRDVDGVSLLYVFRDQWGRVLDGAYAPMNAVKRADGSFNYVGGFPFPQENPFFYLWSVYFPGTKSASRRNEKAKVFLEIRRLADKQFGSPNGNEEGRELFKGKAFLKEMVPAGNFSISVDEVRFWSRMKVIYRPGLPLIFLSFWLALGGISLTTLAKMRPLKNPQRSR